jgi:predicted DNA-binding ribbon-helix-helix protein
MCEILLSSPPEAFSYQTRSVRLGGHATSIKLEGAFWEILEEIAAKQAMPLGRFLTRLHDEGLKMSGDAHNFTSLLRCVCLTYLADVRGKPLAEAALVDDGREVLRADLLAAE